MEPRIERLARKQLVGQTIKMSLAENKTGELWKAFAPRIKEIPNRLSTDKFSLQVYPPNYHQQFDPKAEFEKWALVEVENLRQVPKGMHSFELEAGLYAVFDYRGSSADTAIYQYIYAEWLPQSAYELDQRPHFEVLGERYKNNQPDSEEEIWIPIKA